jgi:hypothetical protein
LDRGVQSVGRLGHPGEHRRFVQITERGFQETMGRLRIAQTAIEEQLSHHRRYPQRLPKQRNGGQVVSQ